MFRGLWIVMVYLKYLIPSILFNSLQSSVISASPQKNFVNPNLPSARFPTYLQYKVLIQFRCSMRYFLLSKLSLVYKNYIDRYSEWQAFSLKECSPQVQIEVTDLNHAGLLKKADRKWL